MSKVSALARGTTAMNLALAGVSVEEVSDAKDAETALDALLNGGTDVLIIEEALRDGFSDRMHERLNRHMGKPLLVNCPSFDEEDSDVDAYLSSVIKPAVGFEIRLV